MNALTEAALLAAPRVTEFTENANISIAFGEMGKASGTGVLPGGQATPHSPPVYWPQKVTLSGRLGPPTPLIPSRADCALSSVVRLFSENHWGEGGSDSEPGWGKEGHQRGTGEVSQSSGS